MPSAVGWKELDILSFIELYRDVQALCSLSQQSKQQTGYCHKRKKHQREKQIPLVEAEVQALYLCFYDLFSMAPASGKQAPFVPGFSPCNKILREPDS